jgi:hypothetical protein
MMASRGIHPTVSGFIDATRRVATVESSAQMVVHFGSLVRMLTLQTNRLTNTLITRRYATIASLYRCRGLKPTATYRKSLRDGTERCGLYQRTGLRST